jgi:hypothetical protein
MRCMVCGGCAHVHRVAPFGLGEAGAVCSLHPEKFRDTGSKPASPSEIEESFRHAGLAPLSPPCSLLSAVVLLSSASFRLKELCKASDACSTDQCVSYGCHHRVGHPRPFCKGFFAGGRGRKAGRKKGRGDWGESGGWRRRTCVPRAANTEGVLLLGGKCVGWLRLCCLAEAR